MAFPAIDPKCEPEEIIFLAENYVDKIKSLPAEANESDNAVHIMGEVTFCFALAVRLQKARMAKFLKPMLLLQKITCRNPN